MKNNDFIYRMGEILIEINEVHKSKKKYIPDLLCKCCIYKNCKKFRQQNNYLTKQYNLYLSTSIF